MLWRWNYTYRLQSKSKLNEAVLKPLPKQKHFSAIKWQNGFKNIAGRVISVQGQQKGEPKSSYTKGNDAAGL